MGRGEGEGRVKERPVVAVVCGGSAAEAEVSRVSGAGVATALRASYAQVHTVELDRDLDVRLRELRPDVVFPVLHGPLGEDGCIQGLLEVLGLPYVGSGVAACACAMDKVIAKQLFRVYGVSVAQDVIVHRTEDPHAAARRVSEALGPEVVVKPTRQGSAIGVSFPTDPGDLVESLQQAWTYDERVLVERRVWGREITVALLERDGLEVLPVIDIRTPPGSWYDYAHRYTPGLSEHVIPAPLPPEQYRRTQELAQLAHQALGCRDLSRVDLVVPEEGEPIVLEVNAMPGMTPTSLYPDAARAVGINFEDLVAHFVERAWSRAVAP
jgi:D-alanine-D-alanine ligase